MGSEFQSNGGFEEVPMYQEFESRKKNIRSDSYFDGGVLELIGWRILGFLITCLTLGIGAPWAKCMIYSYQFKHTVYNGKRLKFEGTGGDLFVNIFKWIFFSIITLGIYTLFIPVRKARWVISNLHYEDESFVKEDSFFDGSTLQLIGVNIVSKILVVLSLGILYPFTVCYKLRWITKHTVINKKKVVFTGKAICLWGKYILWGFLTIITLGIFSLWIPIVELKWQTKNIHIKKALEGDPPKDKSFIAVIPVILVCVLLFVGFTSWFVNSEFKNKYMEYRNEYLEELEQRAGSILKLLSGGRYAEKNSGMSQDSIKAHSEIKEEHLSETSSNEVEQEKQSIKVGNYEIALGTYTGYDKLYDWEQQKEIKVDIKVVLSKDYINVDGENLRYSVEGNEIYVRGYALLEAKGNNKLMYLAQSCPVLTYQG